MAPPRRPCDLIHSNQIDSNAQIAAWRMIAIVLLLVTLTTLYFGYCIVKKPSGYPPGPMFAWPIIGHSTYLRNRSQCQVFQELSKKYGNVFSLMLGIQRVVVLSKFSLLRDTFRSKAAAGKMLTFYSNVRSQGGNGIIFSQGERWSELRRFTLNYFRESGVGSNRLERGIHDEIRGILDRLLSDEVLGKPISLRSQFNVAVLNNLWNICTGERYRHDDPDVKDSLETVERLFMNSPSSGLSQVTPYRKWIPAFVFDNVRTRQEASAKIQQFLQKVIKRVRGGDQTDGGTHQSNYICAFLQKQKDREDIYTGVNLCVTLEDIFVAGSETSANSLTWLFLILSMYPEIQERIHHEIATYIGLDNLPSYEDRVKTPYLEAVLMETWRFASVVPAVAHSTVEQIHIDGYTIPKDTIVFGDLYATHRDPQLWEKPNEFYPEHFLTEDGQFKPNVALIPFGIGKRSCPGEALGRAQFYMFSCALLQHLKFELVGDKDESLLQGIDGFVRSTKPFQVILQKR